MCYDGMHALVRTVHTVHTGHNSSHVRPSKRLRNDRLFVVAELNLPVKHSNSQTHFMQTLTHSTDS